MDKIVKFFRKHYESFYENSLSTIELITKKKQYQYDDPRIRYALPYVIYSANDIKANIYVNHVSPYFSCELLNKYFEFDPRLKIVTDFILEWGSERQIINEFEGFFSSYSLTLLVIFLLELTETPVLYPIQKYCDNFEDKKKSIPSFHKLLMKKPNEGEEKRFKETFKTDINVNYKTIDIEKMKEDLKYPKNNYTPAELITMFYWYFGFTYSVLIF